MIAHVVVRFDELVGDGPGASREIAFLDGDDPLSEAVAARN